jgi:serine/threonine-protein kinase
MEVSEQAVQTAEISSGKYRVLLELGEGGTARVYLAVTSGVAGFNRLVVLKTLKQNLASEPEIQRMFMSEARLSARLNHENIVGVNEVFEQAGLPIIVMQYLEGQPFSLIIAKGGSRLTLGMRLRVISDALSGLHYSHELTDYDGTPLNLVHRDMTPHNLFVTYDGRVKLLDFGIAKIGAAPNQTETGVIKGKLRYMPPEQISGIEVDRRADIFAVGVMLWEAATGDRMWKDLPEVAVMHKVLNGEIPTPSSINPECDAELERIVMKALAEKPEDRFSTALELQTEIDNYISRQRMSASEREIGRFVSEVFAEVRDETKRQIDSLLKEQSSMSQSGSDRVSFIAVPRLATTITATTQNFQKQRWPFAIAVALMLLVAFIGILAVRKKTDNAAALAPPPVQTARAAEVQQRVNVRIAAYPREAKIFLDDKPVGANPYIIDTAPDHQWHLVRAEAPGFASQVQRFRLSADVDLMLMMQKEAPPVVSAKPPAPTKPIKGGGRPAPAKPAGTKPAPDCSPPYTIDEHGLRKLKSECL